MRHLPGHVLSEEQAIEWGNWIGIDEDGSARVFSKEPIKVGDVWVPDEFPGKMYPGCYRVNMEYPESKHGQLLKRKESGNESAFVPVPESEENHYENTRFT